MLYNLSTMNDALRNLGETLINEHGGPFGFVCIWRPDQSVDVKFTGTVGEWLSKNENQSGTWLIDGGWGGPPGPIHVRWNEAESAWENGGFGGRKFEVA